ncbi:hypothetical protein BH09BAC5_BH09BAC5_23080 [soil metagenome]
MKKSILLNFCFFISMFAFSRADVQVTNSYSSYFKEAYQMNPEVPRGVLEAVSFSNTHFNQVIHVEGEEGSCIGLPEYYGVMGLVKDGKNYFRNNLILISRLSGISISEIISNPEKNILAYAAAYTAIVTDKDRSPGLKNDIFTIASILRKLSELPDNTTGQQFALNTQLYGIFTFMNNPQYQAEYDFADLHLQLENYFGDNFKILSAVSVSISESQVMDNSGNIFRSTGNDPELQSTDYPPAIWNAAASCNYSVGRSSPVLAVTIYDIEGSYAGAISWFQNCNASVSAHYVVRSSDGQITQMVSEANKAWHVGSENPYTIGIEHEGYANQNGWYTNAMYTASAALCLDICNSGYGINPIRVAWWPWAHTTYYNVSTIPGSCTKIKGHQHFPNQTHTDPGPNWDWNYFYMLINSPPSATTYTTATGTLYDSGGASGNYSDDERTIWTISPTAATSVSISFNSFNTENTWDYLYIYDGNSVNAPLIGYYTGTNSPGTIVSTGGSLTLEFRSDCATTAAGWNASWTSNSNVIVPANLSVSPLACPNIGVVLNWANSGTGWFVDVSTDANFTTFYNKDVSSLTSVACPGGFCLSPSCTTYLKFQPSTTYYWRIWDGTTETNGPSFTTPDCQYSDFNCTGSFDDTGGPSGNYSGNEDYTFMIAPANAQNVTINFSSFDLELNFDSLFIYDGPNTSSPLIGTYTGTSSPGTITSTDTAMTLHFISDPFVNNTGFTSTWTCTQISTGINEPGSFNLLSVFPNPFSENITINYVLSENSEVEISLVNVLGQSVNLVPSQFKREGKHQEEINLNNMQLSKGIYFLELNVNGEKSAVKIFRQ